MDKIYRRKLIKMAIATALAFSVALVLDIDPGLSFLGPLMVFNSIWVFPDPIGLKQFVLLKTLLAIVPAAFAAAFISGLWGVNSIVIFLFILLIGWGIQTWMPSIISFGVLPIGVYLATSGVLTSSTPYTSAVYLSLMMLISIGLGWLVERLFWPIFDQQGIERQVSKIFQIFQDFSDCTFQYIELSKDGDNGSQKALTAEANRSMRTANKALKTAAMSGGLSQSERDKWGQAIALQARLLAHLLAISSLVQENRENPLLYELAPELSALGDSLSATFAELSVAIVAKQPRIKLSSPNREFKNWQSRLTEMRTAGVTQSYNLVNRLSVGLIEHRLEGLVTDISKILSWLETHRSAVSSNLPSELKPVRS